MKERSVKKFLKIYGSQYPLKKKLYFVKLCQDALSVINDDYEYLLTGEKDLENEKKKRIQIKNNLTIDLKYIQFNKKLKLEMKKKNLMKKQKLMDSAYNNKMMLDMMLNNNKFINFITEKNLQNMKLSNNQKKYINQLSENEKSKQKEKDIFSSIKSFETFNETDKSETSKRNLYTNNSMNKAFSKFAPQNLTILGNQYNSFFKTFVPMNKTRNSKSLKKTLFNIYKNDYDIINHNLPSITNKKIIDENKNTSTNTNTNTNTNNKYDFMKGKLKILNLTNLDNNYNINLGKTFLFKKNQGLKSSMIKFNEINNNFKSKLFGIKEDKNIFTQNYKRIRKIHSNNIKTNFNKINTFYNSKIAV